MCASQWVCQLVGVVTGVHTFTHVLTHVCIHVVPSPQAARKQAGALPFPVFNSPSRTSLSSLRAPHRTRLRNACGVQDPRGWTEQSRGQLAPERTGMTGGCTPDTRPALPYALALEARCHCLLFPLEAPEVQRPHRGTSGDRWTRPEALCSIPSPGCWMVQGLPETPTSQGNLVLGGAAQNPPSHSAVPLLETTLSE